MEKLGWSWSDIMGKHILFDFEISIEIVWNISRSNERVKQYAYRKFEPKKCRLPPNWVKKVDDRFEMAYFEFDYHSNYPIVGGKDDNHHVNIRSSYYNTFSFSLNC